MTEIETYAPRGSMLQPVTDSWVDTMGDVVKLAAYICTTEFVPQGLRDREDDENKGAKTAAAILTGRELGLPPMAALSSIHMVKGRPGISAEMMRGLVTQRGHQIRFGKVSSQQVTVSGRRREDRGDEGAWTEVTWTMQDAEQAGLLRSQPNYKLYPRQMLTARATTELCRLLFADVIHGLRSVEELEALSVDGEVVVEYAPEDPEPVKPGRPRREARVQPVDAQQGDETTPDAEQQEKPATRTTRRRSPSLSKRGTKTGAGAPEEPSNGASAEGQGPDAPAPPDPERGDAQDDSKVAPPATEETTDDAPAETPATPAGAGASSNAEEGQGSPPDPAPSSAPQPDEDGVVDAEIVDEREPVVTPAQVTKLVTVFNKLGVTDRAERLYITSLFAGRDVESANHLTKGEASRVIDVLEGCKSNDELQAVVNHTAEHAEKGSDQ